MEGEKGVILRSQKKLTAFALQERLLVGSGTQYECIFHCQKGGRKKCLPNWGTIRHGACAPLSLQNDIDRPFFLCADKHNV